MNRFDLATLKDRLAQLCDAFGTRPIGAGGMAVWADTLSGCNFEDVLFVLTDWPKKASKMPTPAEIFKLCGTRTSERIERQAAENRMQAISVEEALGRAAAVNRNSEVAVTELRKMTEILSASKGGLVAGSFHHIGGKGPNEDHREWAKLLRVREESGEVISLTQKQAWRAALGVEK